MAHKRKLISVYDEVSGKTFYFKSHQAKEEFFNSWDRNVVKVE